VFALDCLVCTDESLNDDRRPNGGGGGDPFVGDSFIRSPQTDRRQNALIPFANGDTKVDGMSNKMLDTIHLLLYISSYSSSSTHVYSSS
jgi:hypothetical protein